jgi:hypothetical protein
MAGRATSVIIPLTVASLQRLCCEVGPPQLQSIDHKEMAAFRAAFFASRREEHHGVSLGARLRMTSMAQDAPLPLRENPDALR